MIMWGLESGSDEVMTLINKGIDLNKRFEILKNSNDANIWNFAFIFFGFPTETVEDAKKTVDMLVKYKDIIQPLFDNAEEIAHINKNQAIRCMAGMSKEKLKALKHPYPTIVDKINKYGYDPKQLHHILRMNDFIKKYAILEKPYKECLIPDNKEYLIQIKKGILSEDEATKLAIETDEDTYDVKNWATGFDDRPDVINKKGLDILDKTKYEILKMRFQEELKIK